MDEMTTTHWLMIEPTWVRIADLVPTQDDVFPEALAEKRDHPTRSYTSDPFINVVKWENLFYIDDGHTRTRDAAERGNLWIIARVLDLDEALSS